MFWKQHHRYITVGGSVYLFELAAILIGQKLGLSAVGAVAVSFCLGLIVSFSLQKAITFKDRRVHHRILLPQIIAFSILVLFNFTFTISLTKLLSPGVPAVISRTIAIGITTIWNYYLYKTHIFGKNKV